MLTGSAASFPLLRAVLKQTVTSRGEQKRRQKSLNVAVHVRQAGPKGEGMWTASAQAQSGVTALCSRFRRHAPTFTSSLGRQFKQHHELQRSSSRGGVGLPGAEPTPSRACAQPQQGVVWKTTPSCESNKINWT